MPDAERDLSADQEQAVPQADGAPTGSVSADPESADPVSADAGTTEESATDAPATDAPATDPAPIDADEVLLAAVDIARAALLDITPADTIGEPVGHVVEDKHVLSLLFDCTLSGYPGWHWNVSLSRINENSDPFVLETELMPGGESLLAPEWIPWSDRLSDYRAAQDLVAAQAAADVLDDDDEFDEDDEDDDELDSELDEDDLDDDHGDDVLDGIDFETAANGLLNPADFETALTTSELHPAEADETQAEADDSTPEPPAAAGVDELIVEDDQPDQRQ